ncbi:MAG TPA: hypothetical protein ENN84_06745 [Candidatus Marinimicrobia bacterium]|nr:hypothetical protein [Candidatus Neomarinimicrobiota bacterium]
MNLNFISKKLSFTQDLLITLMNVFSVILSTIFINAIISRKYGLDFVGEFNLVKRVALSAAPFILFGASIVIPKLFGEIPEKNYRSFFRQLMLYFLILPLPLLFIFFLLIPAEKGGIHSFYIPENLKLIFALVLAADLVFQLFYSIFRGIRQFIPAALLSFSVNALIPLIFFLLFGFATFHQVYLMIGIFMLATALFFPLLMLQKQFSPQAPAPISLLKPLLSQSAQRAPGMFFQFLLISAPILIISRYGSPAELTYVTVGITISRLLLSIVTPIGFVFLPRIAAQREAGSLSDVSQKLIQISQFFLLLLALMIPWLLINSPWLLNLWIHLTDTDGIRLIHLFIFAIPGIVFYEMVRIPIDALYDRGLNSVILFAGTLSFFITVYFMRHTYAAAVAAAFGAAYLVMTFISLIALSHRKIYLFRGENFSHLFSALLLFLGAIYFMHRYDFHLITENALYFIMTALLLLYLWKFTKLEFILLIKSKLRLTGNRQ